MNLSSAQIAFYRYLTQELRPVESKLKGLLGYRAGLLLVTMGGGEK
jgi:hypothetical protein